MIRQPSASARPFDIQTVKFVAQELIDPIEEWYTATSTLADVDGDGHVDIAHRQLLQENTTAFTTRPAHGTRSCTARVGREERRDQSHVSVPGGLAETASASAR